jgi:hypothetical protein
MAQDQGNERRCWSWRHGGPGPAINEDAHTCLDHLDEEPGIALTLKQLAFCQNEITRGLSGAGRIHLSRYEDVVESNLKGFLQHTLEGFEVRQGNYQTVEGKDRQRDLVVVPRVEVDPDLWSAEVTLPDEFTKSALAVIEVAYAGASREWDGKGGLAEKLKQDLERIGTVIDEGIRADRKIFTGLALVGEGWRPHVDPIARLLHEAHHARNLSRLKSGVVEWWPFVDVVIMPGLLLKKHDLFDKPTRLSSRFPVLFQWPSGRSDECASFRSLAIARGYLRHFIHRARLLEDEEAAFEDGEAAAICGPAPQVDDLGNATSWKGQRVAILLGHPTNDVLQHSRDRDGRIWAPLVKERDVRCTCGAEFLAVAPALDPKGHAETNSGLRVPVHYIQQPFALDRGMIVRTRDFT